MSAYEGCKIRISQYKNNSFYLAIQSSLSLFKIMLVITLLLMHDSKTANNLNLRMKMLQKIPKPIAI